MSVSRHGFTLIEALIAIAIIGIVFVVLASAQITNLRITSDARADTVLLGRAVGVFEEVRTEVLSDFLVYHRGCAVPQAEDTGADCNPERADGAIVVIAGPDENAVGGADDFVREGTVLIRITVDDGRDNELAFTQLLSCLDVSIADLPNMLQCNVCLLDNSPQCGDGS